MRFAPMRLCAAAHKFGQLRPGQMGLFGNRQCIGDGYR